MEVLNLGEDGFQPDFGRSLVGSAKHVGSSPNLFVEILSIPSREPSNITPKGKRESDRLKSAFLGGCVSFQEGRCLVR